MLRLVSLIAIALACAACTTVQYYQPPEELSSENAATVVGSKIEMSAANKDLRTALASVDGKPIGGRGRESWERPVLIPEGEHELLITVTGGESLFKSSRHGFITTKVRLKAGMAMSCDRRFVEKDFAARRRSPGSRRKAASQSRKRSSFA